MCLVTFDWNKNDAVEKFKKYEKQKTASWAVVELTNLCNFRCMWCYAGINNNYKPEHMKKSDAKKLIKILADSGIKQITCSGGEPTLYPDLTDFVKECSDYEIITHLNTNGFLLSKEFASELKDAGLSQVQTNIDSISPREHDKVRGKSGSFDQALKAIRNAKELGLTVVSQTVLTKNNEKEIFDIMRIGRRLGIQRFRVWDMTGEGDAKDKMNLVPTNYVKSLQEISKFAEQNGAINIESCDPLFPLDFRTDLSCSGMGCVAVRGLLMHISHLGDVFYCATHRKRLYNIFKEGRNGKIGIFHKEIVDNYINGIKISRKCVHCRYFSKCRGGCNTRRNFSPTGVDYFCKYG